MCFSLSRRWDLCVAYDFLRNYIEKGWWRHSPQQWICERVSTNRFRFPFKLFLWCKFLFRFHLHYSDWTPTNLWTRSEPKIAGMGQHEENDNFGFIKFGHPNSSEPPGQIRCLDSVGIWCSQGSLGVLAEKSTPLRTLPNILCGVSRIWHVIMKFELILMLLFNFETKRTCRLNAKDI